MRHTLRGGVRILTLAGLAAGALPSGCNGNGSLICLEDQETTANPSHDHECRGNVGCKALDVWEYGCHCDYCANERCVRVLCTDPYPDLGAEAGLDAGAGDGDLGLDAAAPDARPDAGGADALLQFDAALDAALDAAMVDAATSSYQDLAYLLTGYQGGFNPHTTTAQLKAGTLDLQVSTLASGVIKTCKTTLTAQQLATLLAAAGKVSWGAVKPSYFPGASCGYPGDSGELKLTLTPKQGASTQVGTKWCASGGKPQGVPTDLAAFLAVLQTVHGAACP